MKRDMRCAVCDDRTLHEWSRTYANLCWCTKCRVMKVQRVPSTTSNTDEPTDPLKSL